jgi:hypothetical protein
MTADADGARDGNRQKVVFWHRELPPLHAEAMAEHVLEASSVRIPGKLAHRDQLWRECEADLMAQADARLREEIARLGGHYAHVLDEVIEPKRDDAAGTAWLHGRFVYMLYRWAQAPSGE